MIKSHLIKSMKLNKRLLIYMVVLILICCLTVGMTSYFIAKQGLDYKGRVILKNGVNMAIMLIDTKNKEVAKGNLDLAEAQEQVKVYLSGEKNEDGTRKLNSNIDLGQNGYFIVYSQTGDEIMHPTLEGQNKWNVTDKRNSSFFIVQDQINKSRTDNGYTIYTWNLPNSVKLGKKISYSRLDPNWGWVVTATSYTIDFNKDAYMIMKVMVFATVVMLLVGLVISFHFIKGITKPIELVVQNMKLAEKGHYYDIMPTQREDEIGLLVSGFNEMVTSLSNANKNIISKEEEITHMAYYDQLSGLPNRNKFKEFVNQRMARSRAEASIILFDIKDFKLINSVLGNEFGNKIIRSIGTVLKNFQNDEIFFSILSGNEFAAWIENCDEMFINENIKKFKIMLFEELKNIEFNQKLFFHISYSTFPKDGVDFEGCYKKATIAMNFAKENSPTRIFKFEQNMAEAIEKDSLIRKYVEQAIRNEEFEVYYQNKVNIKYGRVVGVEALARWNSKDLGFVSPSIFIPAIDKSNLTAKFTKIIVKRVLKDYPRLAEKFSEDVTVSINISPLFFLEKNFTDFIKHSLKCSGVSPGKVMLEITEDIFINEFDSIKKIITELKSFGVKISLDDFGTGYSSLNYLKNVEFDELKIDKSFIQGALSDKRNYELLKVIEKIAKIYKYSVVAEGVETEEQLEKVIQSKFDIVQGYYYSKPEPL